MVTIRTLVSALTVTGAAMALAGCLATTPSYYSERVTSRSATSQESAKAAAVPVTEEAAPRRRTARRAVTPEQPSASAARRGEPATPPTSTRTTAQYRARLIATDGSSANEPTREETAQRDQERFDRREQAIRRSLDSICRGC